VGTLFSEWTSTVASDSPDTAVIDVTTKLTFRLSRPSILLIRSKWNGQCVTLCFVFIQARDASHRVHRV
jgi:hypothetical protein